LILQLEDTHIIMEPGHDLSHETDSDIVRRCLQGDTNAFCHLVKRYQTILYNIIYRILGDSDDTADVLQDVFVKAFEKLRTFDQSKRFYAWMYRIAVNESINFIHHHDRMIHLIEESCISTDDLPDIVLQKADTVQMIDSALQRIRPEQRVLIILKNFGELSYHEISEILGISEKTVKSRLYTARNELRKEMIHLKTN